MALLQLIVSSLEYKSSQSPSEFPEITCFMGTNNLNLDSSRSAEAALALKLHGPLRKDSKTLTSKYSSCAQLGNDMILVYNSVNRIYALYLTNIFPNCVLAT